MLGKVCTKCNQLKFITEYHRNPKTKDGYYGQCKSCCAKYQKAYRRKHKAELSEAKRQYREEHREEVLAKKRAYTATHSAKENARSVWWQKLNPAKVIIRSKLRRVRERASGGELSRDEWVALCAKYDHRCLACGKQKPLEPDHIVPVIHGGSGDVSNIQPLCRSCNAKKGTKTIDYRERG